MFSVELTVSDRNTPLPNSNVSGGTFTLGGTRTQDGALAAALKREEMNADDREVKPFRSMSHL